MATADGGGTGHTGASSTTATVASTVTVTAAVTLAPLPVELSQPEEATTADTGWCNIATSRP